MQICEVVKNKKNIRYRWRFLIWLDLTTIRLNNICG